MPFAFNGAAKTITWSGGPLNVRDMWSRYLDWLAISDNSKYDLLLRTVGMDTADIPFYVFLELGVVLIVTDNSIPTNIFDGVIKTDDNRDPFNGAIVNVRYDSPGIAIGYTTGSGVTPQDKTDIIDGVWSRPITSMTTDGSIGKWILTKLLTVSKFLGLK